MEQDVLKGNKIIAEFMGETPSTENNGNPAFFYIEKGNSFSLVQYHSSWDWLMPVWIKVMLWYRAEFGLMTSTFKIDHAGIYIKSTNNSAFKSAYLFTREITEEEIKKAVFETLVAFINWYNKQPKK